MPIFIKDNKYFLFVHVPKTGGTSLEVVFARSGSAAAYIDFGGKGTLNHLRRCAPQHMHGELLQSQFVIEKFDGIFMVVRNPYDRFRSEYCMAHPVNCDPSGNAVEAWAEKVFAEYAEDNYVHDNHIRPQNEFFVPGAVVFRFEQGFTNIIMDIASRYGVALIRDNVKELARSKRSGVSPSAVELNRAVVEMINRQYKRDFEQFEYEMMV